jgi:hypothetical protein
VNDAAETLRVGGFSVARDGADLTDLRWGGLEIASRVLVTLRDRDWGTVVPLPVRSAVREGDEGPVMELQARHEDAEVGFSWHGILAVTGDGSVDFSFDGVAERDFIYRRIGICVLHPWRTYVGAAYEATTPDGVRAGTFPEQIAPQLRVGDRYLPMIEAFSELTVRFPGAVAALFTFEGELFELEDQRNWTDASFKTYPTPLVRSEPRQIRSGERVRQRMVLRLAGEAPRITEPPSETAAVWVGGPVGRLPPVGVTAPAPPNVGPAHIRVVAQAGTDGAQIGSAAGGPPLEIELVVGTGREDLSGLAQQLPHLAVARILVHLADERTTPREIVRLVRDALGVSAEGIPFVAGTSTYFSEIARNPPGSVPTDGISFSISPEVHATDRRSIVETLEIQEQVVRRAAELAHGAPIVVSPVTLTSHRGTAFADAWTLGSLSHLILAGASSITCDASHRIVTQVAAMTGNEVLRTRVTDHRRVAALAVRAAPEPVLLVANLLPSEQPLRIDDHEEPALGPFEVRRSG